MLYTSLCNITLMKTRYQIETKLKVKNYVGDIQIVRTLFEVFRNICFHSFQSLLQRDFSFEIQPQNWKNTSNVTQKVGVSQKTYVAKTY